MPDIPESSLQDILHKMWLSPAGLQSYHSDRGANYNENNAGLGMEYDSSKHTKLAAGKFLNSLGKDSRYAGAALLGRPFDSIEPLRLGLLLGLIDGYPEMRKGGLFPMAAPMASYEGKNFGFNVLGLPKVGDVSPVVAAQMKLRF